MAPKMPLSKMKKDTFAHPDAAIFGAAEYMSTIRTKSAPSPPPSPPPLAAPPPLASLLPPPRSRAMKPPPLVAHKPSPLALEKNKAPEAHGFDAYRRLHIEGFGDVYEELPSRRHDEGGGGQPQDTESKHGHQNPVMQIHHNAQIRGVITAGKDT